MAHRDFATPRWMRNAHVQTLGAAFPFFSPPRSHLRAATEELRIPLGATHKLHARAWWAGDIESDHPRPAVVLVHGIGGSSTSRTVVRTAVALHRAGFRLLIAVSSFVRAVDRLPVMSGLRHHAERRVAGGGYGGYRLVEHGFRRHRTPSGINFARLRTPRSWSWRDASTSGTPGRRGRFRTPPGPPSSSRRWTGRVRAAGCPTCRSSSRGPTRSRRWEHPPSTRASSRSTS